MGAYLSEPVTEKISTDDDSERVRYGASSMQGWRISQEDAHNCVIDFDKNTSLFAVYDGHGGHEVAAYCSQKLPEFIKETEAYKNGDLNKALIDAFLEFDATIATREVVAILKDIAGVKDNDKEVGSEDEENVNNLYEEASMPIEQVMEKYQNNLMNPYVKKLQGDNKCPISPMLKSKKSDESSSSATCSSSSSAFSSKESEDTSGDSSKKDPNDQNLISSASSENGDTKIDPELKSSEEATKSEKIEDKIEDKVVNGQPEEKTVPQANGEVTSKGKGKAIIKKIPEPPVVKNLRVRNARQLYNKLLDVDDGSDTEDSNDETFEGAPQESSEESCEGSSDDADDESSEADDADDENEVENEEETMYGEDESDEFTRNMTEEPGSDSGCTAVVALLHGNELFVANAGDSRCIISRNGEAVEMSFDHKPEDEPEMARILKAGGKVTQDGRVNGGLNLSRAIGDHAYKQNKELTDREQMITALPDIKTLTINPAEDEFMVLACDGIWNFMSSQEVVDFVKSRLDSEKLSQICEEMFDHCLAPNTMGDGTGCDNMTAVIVQFKNGLMKRSATPTEEENVAKKAKTE